MGDMPYYEVSASVERTLAEGRGWFVLYRATRHLLNRGLSFLDPEVRLLVFVRLHERAPREGEV